MVQLSHPYMTTGKTIALTIWTIGRAEAEAPILWPPDSKSQLIGKDPDAGQDWGQEKGMTGDGMVGCHHWLNGQEFEQTLGEGQGSLACCSPWGCKEMDIDLGTEQQQQRYKVNKLHVWILKTWSWTRECRHKRAHSVWFQAHEI